MAVKITGFATDYYTNTTEVSVEILEMSGTITKVRDLLKVKIQGRYETINHGLLEAVYEELRNNGLEPFPLTN